MKALTTLLDAIGDRQLFSSWFKKRSSWENWFTFIAALFALPMTPQQLATYQQCTGREAPPDKPITEVWLAIGRRGGKSFILALIAVFLACFREYRQHLIAGERGTIIIIAQDRKAARTIFRYVKGLLTGVPMLARMIEHERADSFDLTNRITIEIQTASFRATRGYTLVAALCDEIAFWRSDESANPDKEILQAIRPATATIPNAMLLCASSPYARRGAMWDAYRKHYGKDSPVLFWKAPTRTMNPSVPQSFIDAAYEDDAASATAEYGAEFRTDLESFISREVVDAAVCLGRHELPPRDGVPYVAFVDPSGGSGTDSMTLAIAHMEGDRAILDCVRERKPHFSTDDAAREFADTIKTYGIASCQGDRYAGDWPRQGFAVHGVDYQFTTLTPKAIIYLNLLPMLNSKRVELLELATVTGQLCSLERQTGRGRDIIDHPSGGHDDIIDAVAGALVAAAQRQAQEVPIVAPIICGGPHDTPIPGQQLSTTEKFYRYYNGGGGGQWWGPV
ncbi:hypothetical protein SAMN05444169_2927 [Bradyrhizobium erythrophlei]|uniref:Phage terminase-like protein, large subunit, contains N-terminal HTH domain n=1 Tax=Bradyrhizobium erythrophlei TaxID=1437360 RepID=A0A1M5KKX3_9BRAD|nr:hypothetical protein SAMN05444169_2927 [Bradyrhizobium erythrophlei]